jgi:hypothetical protein
MTGVQQVGTHLIQELGTLDVFLPERDTLERAQARVEIALDLFYDGRSDYEEPDQPIRDLLSDLVHYCRERGIDLDYALERAEGMAAEEL